MRYFSKRLLHLGERLVIAGLLLLGGCGRTSEEAAYEPEPEAFYFEPLGRGQHAAFTDTTEVVIRDAETWARYQNELRPVQPFEAVDFTQAMVFLAAVPSPAGGYLVEFEAVEEAGDTITASYLLTAPGRDCLAVSAPAVPYEAILTRRDEAPVRFQRHTATYPCSLR